MNLLRQIWAELVGLFVDDGALATQTAVLVAVLALLTKGFGCPPLWAAALLLPGCLAILTASLIRARRK